MEEAAGRPLEVMLLVTSLQKGWLCAIDLQLMVADVVPQTTPGEENTSWRHCQSHNSVKPRTLAET